MRTYLGMRWSYEIWYDGCCITEDYDYETEMEAEEEAEEMINSYLEEWEDTERDDYKIRLKEEL